MSKLPNFLVVGVMKAGTSGAALNLNMHPEIYCITPYWKKRMIEKYSYNTGSFVGGMSNENSKEMDFFNLKTNYDHGIDVYKSFFPINSVPNRGESSPNYFCLDENRYSGCMARMAEGLDTENTKIIVFLRDPITRAYSHWNHIQQPGTTFGQRYNGKTFNECTEQASNPAQKNAILGRSLYANNLASFRSTFGGDNVYVVTQESMVANPLVEYNKIFNFLGTFDLPTDPGFIMANVSDYTGSIDSQSLNWCKDYFKNDVTLVKALYPDLDYSGWNSY